MKARNRARERGGRKRGGAARGGGKAGGRGRERKNIREREL